MGASAAGLFAAKLLAERGAAVRVFERQRRLDPEPRTLIVTSHFRGVLGPVGDLSVTNQIRRFELFADGQVASIELKRPDLIVERAMLIQSLAQAARTAGAELFTGRRFRSLDVDAGRVWLRFQDEEGPETEEASIVVGADGAHSAVAASSGWPAPKTVPVVQAIVRLPEGWAPSTAKVWFRPDETSYFFWLLPEGPERAAVGLIGAGMHTRRLLDTFLEEKELAPISYQAARVPLYRRGTRVRRRLDGADVYLVGDAAAQVKVSTVGGLVSGLRGARAVAESILTGGSKEARRLRRELSAHLLIRRAIERFTEDDYRTLLRSLRGRDRALLGTHSRDESIRMLLRLGAVRPRLTLLGLRKLLLGRRA